MSYRSSVSRLVVSQLFMTDGGLETDLLFNKKIHLPHFAACTLLRDEAGREILRRYFAEFAQVAIDRNLGFIIDTATWRANPDWIEKLGGEPSVVRDLNRAAVELALSIRDEFEQSGSPMPINGVIGPRDDGYAPSRMQSVEEARSYHSAQIEVLADTQADFVTATTMNYVGEAAGIALAARDAGIPVAISFTLETDGRLITGETLQHAIGAVDSATDGAPLYFMVNCCHPTHLPESFASIDRVHGYRANASSQSHAELDESEELDAGNVDELAQQMRHLRDRMPGLTVLGGCCGTDLRHLERTAAGLAG